MYDHILVPTAGDAHGTRALREAVSLAEALDASITVLTVVRDVDAGRLDTFGTAAPENALQHAEREKGRSQLDATLTDVDTRGVAVETAIVAGIPYREICDYVAASDVDLVVIGSSGRRGIVDSVLGRTSERIVQRCDVPALIV